MQSKVMHSANRFMSSETVLVFLNLFLILMGHNPKSRKKGYVNISRCCLLNVQVSALNINANAYSMNTLTFAF